MTPADQERFPALPVTLRNGTPAMIRPLRETDGEALAAFYAGIPEGDAYYYCPHPLTREYALRNAANAGSPTEVVLVLEVSGCWISGYAWYRWAEGANASTFGICVARPFQGTGAARQLIARLKEIAPTVGPPVMSLTVQKINPRAVELYKSMGFQIVRDQLRAADGCPEYYMELKVS